jgi:hypothetical protein
MLLTTAHQLAWPKFLISLPLGRVIAERFPPGIEIFDHWLVSFEANMDVCVVAEAELNAFEFDEDIVVSEFSEPPPL